MIIAFYFMYLFNIGADGKASAIARPLGPHIGTYEACLYNADAMKQQIATDLKVGPATLVAECIETPKQELVTFSSCT